MLHSHENTTKLRHAAAVYKETTKWTLFLIKFSIVSLIPVMSQETTQLLTILIVPMFTIFRIRDCRESIGSC